MTNKRKHHENRDGESALYNKRSRPNNQDDLPTSSQSRIDPTYGQRGAFPGLDSSHDDHGLFYGPANDGLEYLRMVSALATIAELTAFCIPIDQKLRLSPTSSSPPCHPLFNQKRTTSTKIILKATTSMARILPPLFLSPTPVRHTRMVGNKKIKILKRHTTLRSARALRNLPKRSNFHPLALRQTTQTSTILIGADVDHGVERY